MTSIVTKLITLVFIEDLVNLKKGRKRPTVAKLYKVMHKSYLHSLKSFKREICRMTDRPTELLIMYSIIISEENLH